MKQVYLILWDRFKIPTQAVVLADDIGQALQMLIDRNDIHTFTEVTIKTYSTQGTSCVITVDTLD